MAGPGMSDERRDELWGLARRPLTVRDGGRVSGWAAARLQRALREAMAEVDRLSGRGAPGDDDGGDGGDDDP